MNVRNFIIICILLGIGFSATAADGLKIEIEAPQLKGKTLKLVNYFNGGNYTQDTLLLSKKGIGSFNKSKNIPEGLYIIYIDSLLYFDILLADDQAFKIKIDTTGFVSSNIIEGSEQTEAFQQYTQFIVGRQRERQKLFDERNAPIIQIVDTAKIRVEVDSLNASVSAFQKDFFEKHEGQWVAKFFRGLNPIETGPYPIPKTQEEAIEQFKYLKYHFFDNVDLKDKRFWFTNYFPQKVDQYIKKQVEFIPDSVAKAASWLVAQTMGGDSLCFRIVLNKLVNYGIQSEYMGMENVWAKLAEDYYLKGLVPYADSSFLANIKGEYKKIMYNRIGMTARDLPLLDSLGNKVNLYDVTKKYTLVYFFEPNCGHCRKTTPRMHDELFKKYKDKGFTVACICTITDRAEWLKFIYDHGLTDWNNLWDPDRNSYFWQFYDTSITPGIYLINDKKEIIAKKLEVDDLDKLLGNLLGETTFNGPMRD